jgi:hypothetical protein
MRRKVKVLVISREDSRARGNGVISEFSSRPQNEQTELELRVKKEIREKSPI